MIKKTAFAALAAVLAFIILIPLSACKKQEEKKAPPAKQEPPAAPPERKGVEISRQAQGASGIITEELKPVSYREQTEAYGIVLPSNPLIEMRQNYVSAVSAVDRAQALLGASQKEYARLKALNEDNKNVSDKAVQAASAALAASRASRFQAGQDLLSVKAAIKLKWGNILSGWIFNSSPGYRRLVNIQDVLVQVTLPATAKVISIPGKISVRDLEGGLIAARFVARAPSTDPRIQGVSFFCIAPSYTTRLLPGMNVTAYLPGRQAESGYIVPLSAIIWLQDRAWAYVQKNPTLFQRIEVPTTQPMKDGYFVTGVFPPASRIVVHGAQSIFSQESAPQFKSQGGEGDGD